MSVRIPFWVQLAIAAALLVALPLLVFEGSYSRHLLTLTLIFACLAVSLNLVMGYAGLVSVAHGAFFGIGAYSTAILTATAGQHFAVSVLVGMAIAAIAGAIVGAATLRLRGHYFALGTLAFTMVAVIVFERWEELTRGSRGIPNIPRPAGFEIGGASVDFMNFWPMYVLVSLVLILLLVMTHLIVSSPFGRALLCIRRNELLGSVYGVNVVSAKLRIFALSAAMASVAGSLYSSYIAYISPNDTSFMRSFEAIMYVVVGGAGTVWGPILGATFVHIVPELLRDLEELRLLLLGGILVAVVRFYPAGLAVGLVEIASRVAGRLRARPPVGTAGQGAGNRE